MIYAGPNIGSDDYPTFRPLVTADITSLIAAGGGISKSDSGARITISNSGIRNISPGSEAGTLEVNKNGQATIVSIPGLGTAAYHDVEDFSSDAIKYALSDVRGGDALKAKQLSTSSSIRVNLASTSSASFNGTQSSLNPGVTGILPITNGGTGSSAGLTKINNTAQSSQNTVYAPTTAGTANQILVSSGGTAAPTWKATSSGAAYATSTNGPLTFGTLPIAQGGTGNTNFPKNSVLYTENSNTINQIKPLPTGGANRVLMSNDNGSIAWRPSGDVMGSADWSNISGWNNTYVWDTLNTANNLGWQTELGPINKYTHGISGTTIHLCRGSLTQIISGSRNGIYKGNGQQTNSITFDQNWMPRILLIHSPVTWNPYLIIDLFNLNISSSNNPVPRLYPMITNPFFGINSTEVKVDWATSSCKKINITFGYNSSDHGEYIITYFNLENEYYTFCAIA